MDGAAPARPLWERIETERLRKGWNTTDLAKRAGVQRSTIYRLADGKRPPLPETVIALADTLGINRAEAFALAGLGAPGPASDNELGIELRDDVEREIAALKIPADERRSFIFQRRQRLEEEERQRRDKEKKRRSGNE